MKGFLDKVDSQHYFVLKNGFLVRSLPELSSVLEHIDDEIFHHHVNFERNDFASWVEHVIGDNFLKNNIMGVSSKQEMLDVLNLRINELQSNRSELKEGFLPEDDVQFDMPAEGDLISTEAEEGAFTNMAAVDAAVQEAPGNPAAEPAPAEPQPETKQEGEQEPSMADELPTELPPDMPPEDTPAEEPPADPENTEQAAEAPPAETAEKPKEEKQPEQNAEIPAEEEEPEETAPPDDAPPEQPPAEEPSQETPSETAPNETVPADQQDEQKQKSNEPAEEETAAENPPAEEPPIEEPPKEEPAAGQPPEEAKKSEDDNAEKNEEAKPEEKSAEEKEPTEEPSQDEPAKEEPQAEEQQPGQQEENAGQVDSGENKDSENKEDEGSQEDIGTKDASPKTTQVQNGSDEDVVEIREIEAIPIGLQDIDQHFPKGVPKICNMLFMGTMSTGKTLTALRMLRERAKQGEKAMYISMHDSEEKIINIMKTLDENILEYLNAGNLQIKKLNPFEIVHTFVEHDKSDSFTQLSKYLEFVEVFSPQIVVVDSLSSLELSFGDNKIEYRHYVDMMFKYFEKLGLLGVFVKELKQDTDVNKEFYENILADTILYFYKNNGSQKSVTKVIKEYPIPDSAQLNGVKKKEKKGIFGFLKKKK